MNNQTFDILNALYSTSFTNQRDLAKETGHSLGIVNRCIKELIAEGYIDAHINLTSKAQEVLRENTPQNAVILAAGYGMRMVPINTETPKGLLEVKGEPLIERLIKQLHEVGIRKIYVIVGYMKEHYEYLIDEYDVELVVCEEYSHKNNLHSLKLVKERISNSYIIPCDVWCAENPFHKNEFYSWYMMTDSPDKNSSVRVNRKMQLVSTSKEEPGNTMLGISYLHSSDSPKLRQNIECLSKNPYYDNVFWEEALIEKDHMFISARVVSDDAFVEINTYEQLRELDHGSNQLQTEAIDIICQAMHVTPEQIINIKILKKGMTNRSFLFDCRGKQYIMRIPGEGTQELINRKEEAAVYQVIKDKHVCDDIVYINPQNGYKITEFLHNARNCDPFVPADTQKCMNRLHDFHEKKLAVPHRFDIFKQIAFYESLWNGKPSIYRDYLKTKENVLSLKQYIEKHKAPEVLTHIDAVPDNFIFIQNETGEEDIRLIDWEYAGMQDPHVDIAMFCIYAMYSKEQVDALIDQYFTEGCSPAIRIKIYCYIAACGLLWSNWCEYKRELGIEFGEYSLRQYRYAKEYYKIVQNELHS